MNYNNVEFLIQRERILDIHFRRVRHMQRPVSVTQETPRGGGLDLSPKRLYIPYLSHNCFPLNHPDTCLIFLIKKKRLRSMINRLANTYWIDLFWTPKATDWNQANLPVEVSSLMILLLNFKQLLSSKQKIHLPYVSLVHLASIPIALLPMSYTE